MFFLRTGTPGSGKTLSIIDELRHIKDRPIFYSGIPDLKLDWIKIDDAKNYHDFLPEGAIFVLDECQQVFPVRPPKDPVPPAIAFLEIHRHHGNDIYFITQHPSLLDHHARRLIGQHTHLQRNFGMPFATKYTNNKLFDSTNYHELQTCEKEQYKYPKDVFNLYKSAEIHTHKPKLPKKLLLIIPLLLFIGFGVNFIYGMLHKPPSASLTTDSINSLNSSSQVIPVNLANSKSIDWKSTFTPVIQGLPFTAPIFADIASKPVSMPLLAGCIASQDKLRCSCYSQQSTIIDMPFNACLAAVKHQAFNPYKSDVQPNQQIASIQSTTITSSRA